MPPNKQILNKGSHWLHLSLLRDSLQLKHLETAGVERSRPPSPFFLKNKNNPNEMRCPLVVGDTLVRSKVYISYLNSMLYSS